MRLRIAALMAGLSACGGSEPKSPRAACLEAEETINAAAKECDPQFAGRIVLSCDNFGTGSGCDAIEAYFDCRVETSCDNGTLVHPTCQLTACD